MAQEPSFWQQLRERRVVRVAVVYVAAAWASAEASALVTDVFALPIWVPRVVFVLLALGFPVALALAWAFDVTPSGVKRTPPPATARARAPLVVGLAGVAAVSVALAAWWWTQSGDVGPRAVAAAEIPTLAILPFENRSSVPDQAYFVDGLHDDLIIELSKIDGLMVTGRPSVMGYRGAVNPREVADDLGVSAIGTGSVDRAGDRIRVNVQLIDPVTGGQLIAESYDTILAPETIFPIRSELTLRIAEAMSAALTPDEERRIQAVPTGSLDAYDLVLRGRELYEGSPEDVEKALELFTQATRVAPDYADAWAWLGMAYRQRAQKGGYGPEMRDSARLFAAEAIRVDPENARGHYLLGDLERALRLRPNWEGPLITQSTAHWWRRRHVEGLRIGARARQVAPRYALVAEHVADHLYYLLFDEESDRWMGVAEEIDPGYYWIAVFRSLYAAEREEFEEAELQLALVRQRDPGDPNVPWLEMRIGLLQRDAPRVEAAARALVRGRPDWDWWGQQVQSRALLAWALVEQGREDEVGGLLDDALARAESPTHPQETYAAAQALMVQGSLDAAIERLHDAVAEGFPNLRLLRLDPIWDPLRDAPRFVEAVGIIEEDLARQRAEAESIIPTIP
jgi:TolB-like protein